MTCADPRQEDARVAEILRDGRHPPLRCHSDQIGGVDEVDDPVGANSHPTNVAEMAARDGDRVTIRRALPNLLLLARGKVAVAGGVANEAVVIESRMSGDNVHHPPVRRPPPNARAPRIEPLAVVPEMLAVQIVFCISTKFVRVNIRHGDAAVAVGGDPPNMI